MWGEAVKTAAYLINRMETNALNNNKTPVEIWYNQKPNFDKIKLFGCDVYNLIPKEVRKWKLDSHREKLIMIGYTENGYQLSNPQERKVVIGRNVVFNEKDDRDVIQKKFFKMKLKVQQDKRKVQAKKN